MNFTNIFLSIKQIKFETKDEVKVLSISLTIPFITVYILRKLHTSEIFLLDFFLIVTFLKKNSNIKLNGNTSV